MSGKNNRILFIHAPKKCADTDGTEIREIMALPVGLFALASMCATAGWETEIIHLGIEEIIQPGFNIAAVLKSFEPHIVALSLHWHQQLAEVLKTAKTIKRLQPHAIVIVGGITATYFASQIIEHFPYIDAVISGDAEAPLLKLLQNMKTSHENAFSDIPNLAWRRHGQAVFNPCSYACGKETIDQLDYTSLSLLRHSKHYTGAIEYPKRGNQQSALWGSPRIAHVVVGRGCTRNCSYCSGASENQKKTFFRSGVVIRNTEKVSEDIRKLITLGFDVIYFSFAPHGTDGYYFQLFEILKSKKISPAAVVLEYFGGLPSTEFLSRFSNICDDATIVFSPASAVKSIRLFHKLPSYTNDELEETVSIADRHRVKTEMYFSLLPSDTPKSLVKTLKWTSRLQDCFNASCRIVPIEIEPGSDWFERPEHYKLKLLRKNVVDFANYHESDQPFGLSEKLGYTILDEKEKAAIIGQISALLNRN